METATSTTSRAVRRDHLRKRRQVNEEGQGIRPSNATPVFNPNGELTREAQVQLPPQTSDLRDVVAPGYLFTGRTTIALTGTSMTVTNASRNGGAPTSMALPGNGVVFVENGACTIQYKPQDSEASEPGCGDVRVSGSFGKSLTIAARKDIIVEGDVTRASSTALLGLIAEGFVRVYHPVTGDCENARAEDDLVIDAAILSLNHSFTVDNYRCGDALGDLTVTGAIAQKHRGAVGVGGATITSGYVKDYRYNDQLQYRSPTYFLNPEQPAWRILRQTEQSPAR